MAMPRLFLAATILSVVLAIFGILFFFQYKDPMMLIFPLQGAFYAWLIAGIIHVWRVGIPVRIVGDKGP